MTLSVQSEVGEGWVLLPGGAAIQPGDGFQHPAYPSTWIDFACRPDLFRGERAYVHTWPWRRRATEDEGAGS